MSKQIIVYLCLLILSLHTVAIARGNALKRDDSEQPFTIYLDAGNEIGNVANSIATYANKQDTMEQTLKSVQKVMEKVEQRLLDLEQALKNATSIQDIVEPYMKSLENRLIYIANNMKSSKSLEQKNHALIEQRLDELGLKLTSALSTYAANQTTTTPTTTAELEDVEIISDKANVKLEAASNETAWWQPRVYVDCAAAKQQLGTHYKDGIYEISVPNFQPFNMYCWSGCSSCCPWTVVMHGSEQSEANIYQRYWLDYKNGFGNARKDYFIGLDRLHVLTKLAPQALLIHDYIAEKGNMFEEFSIKDEQNNYVVDLLVSSMEHLWGFKSEVTAAGSPFSSDSVCAKMRGRSWWYNEVCVASFGRDSFSDNIIMAIRPQKCHDGIANN